MRRVPQGAGSCRRVSAVPRALSVALSLVAVVAGAGGLPAAAQPIQAGPWWPLGPLGGSVLSLAPVPASAGTVWAGAPGVGVWKSIDAGASWVPKLLTAGDQTIVVADPVDPLTVYVGAGGGLFKSSNGGATWTLLRPAGQINALAAAPSSPQVLYEAETSARTDLQGVAGFVTSMWRSADSGTTWRELNLPYQAFVIDTVVVDPIDPNVLYVSGTAFYSDPVFFSLSSRDGGATWQYIDGPWSPLLVDPRRPSTLFAVSDGTVYRSDDGGASWSPAGPPHDTGFFALSLALDPASGALYAGGELLPTPRQGQIWKSRDGGLTWSLAHQRASAIVALAVLAGRVYAAADDVGLLVSGDAGGHWAAANPGIAAVPIVDITPDPQAAGTLYAAFSKASLPLGGLSAGARPRGAAKSTDGGVTWAPINQGLLDFHGFPQLVNRLVADPQSPGVLYAALSAGVFKSTDGGRSWLDAGGLGTPGPTWLMNDVVDLAIHPHDSRTLVVAGTSISGGTGAVAAISHDGGASWAQIPDMLGRDPYEPAKLGAVVFDPSSPTQLFVGGRDGLIMSFDGGASWARSGLALPSGQAITRLRMDADHVLYAVLAPGAHTLYRSADAGFSWTAIDGDLPAGSPVRDLLLDPRGAALYAGTDTGVYGSQDGGRHWVAHNEGLSDPRVTRLVADPTRPGVLYAGTPGGLFVSPAPSGTCIPGDTVLCLSRGRFAARLAWTLRHGASVASGAGHARPLAAGTGAFWFFSPDNDELLLKIVDGAAVNGHFWVFYAALSDVAYTLTLTDTATGEQRTYTNPAGKLTSFADTRAFSAASPATAGGFGGPAAGSTPLPPSASRPEVVALVEATAAGCVPAKNRLCLAGARFQVEVTWLLPGTASTPAAAVPLSPDSGAFWFFSPESEELVAKVVDGRPLNGHFWVFLAGLSDIGYTVTVTDTATGARKQYAKPPGALVSQADTSF
ncbi:MAG TPA: hypothetical protein VHR45_16140 [Thermoanaerobaculia bacterium]|nr:hypothetical protein [Thermoanaerobaculia bacterium]